MGIAGEAEFTRDEMIKAQMAKIQAKEEAQIRAEAEAIVERELAAAAEAKRLADEAVASEKARVAAAKERAKVLKSFAGLVAEWMIANDCDNPASIPASVVSDLKLKGGL